MSTVQHGSGGRGTVQLPERLALYESLTAPDEQRRIMDDISQGVDRDRVANGNTIAVYNEIDDTCPDGIRVRAVVLYENDIQYIHQRLEILDELLDKDVTPIAKVDSACFEPCAPNCPCSRAGNSITAAAFKLLSKCKCYMNSNEGNYTFVITIITLRSVR